MLGALVTLLANAGLASAAGQAASTGSGTATNGRIAFVLGASPGKCKGKFGDLATANPDGSQCQVLTKTRDGESPALNPAGDTIAFARAQPQASSIYVIGVRGRGERELIPGPASEPTWSPDGTRIAFTGQQSGSSQIYIADAHTGAIVAQLTSGAGGNSQPAWSPDGGEIAFISDRSGSNRLYVMRADGSNQQPLTQDGGADFNPTWSPDSQRIAFANDQLAPPKFQIYVVNRDGTGESQVTHNNLSDASPNWSPDGRLIAFTSYSGTRGGNSIGLARAPGGSTAGPLPQFPGEQPAWAPLPQPSTPRPGVTVDATPQGEVQIQPGGSSLAEPLNGPVSVPVTATAPTIFRPARGASVTLRTRLTGGRSSVITISEGAVEVSQPGGQSTILRLMGEVSASCPRGSTATAAYVLEGKSWHVVNKGNAHPRAVKGKANLYFQGTDVRVRDMCRLANGLQKLHFVLLKGNATLNGVPLTANGSSGNPNSRVLQLLRASAHGKFHTRGRYSAATVAG